jgi:hypothetical protein
MLIIFRLLLLIALLWNQVFIPPAFAQTAVGNQFYVDTAIGLDTNPGTIAAPFKTIQKCATVAKSGNICNIADGVYRETVTPANGGVTFLGTGKNAVVSGADIVPASAWSVDSGNIYKATIPLGLNVRVWNQITDNQVFYGNQMLPVARFPNYNDLSLVTHPTAIVGKQEDFIRATGATYTATTGHFDAPSLGNIANFTGGKITYTPGFRNVASTCDITSKSGTGVNFTCNPDPGFGGAVNNMNSGTGTNTGQFTPVAGNYFEVWGKKELLDAQGEWFYDPSTTRLSVWLPDSSNPANSLIPIQVKKRLYAFNLSGKAGITIKNLTLFASTIQTNTATNTLQILASNVLYPWHYYQAPPFFQTSGTAALILAGSNNLIADSYFFGSPGTMIDLSAPAGQTANSGNKITNTVIADSGYIANGSAVAGSSPGGAIAQSTIYNAGRYPVQMSKGVNVTNNDLYNSHLQIDDLGIIYGWGVDGSYNQGSANTLISGNWIHDGYAEVNNAVGFYGTHGIEADDDVTGFDITRNIIWGTSAESMIMASYDPNNTQNVGKTNVAVKYYNNSGETFDYLIKNINGTPGLLTGYDMRNNIFSKANSIPTVPGINGTVTVSNNYLGNPGYSASAKTDYRLAFNSPALNAGVDLGSYTTGFTGTAPDIGAIESPAPLPTPGALVRVQDLPDIRVSCTKLQSNSTVANCIIPALPSGRKAGSNLAIKVGTAIASGFINVPNYTTHQGSASLAVTVPATTTGITSIALSVDKVNWTPAGTSNLSGTTISSVVPNTGTTGTKIVITGTQFNTNPLSTRVISVNNPTSSNLSNYQVPLTVDTATPIAASKMLANGGDIRFIDANGTNLNYWIESGINTTTTKIWVKAPLLPANTVTTLTMSYGDVTLTSQSDPKKVFIQYADLTQGDPGFLADVGVTANGVTTAFDGVNGVRVSGTPTSGNQYGTFGFRLDPSKPQVSLLPPSYAIDSTFTVTQGTGGAKISAGGFDSTLAIEGSPYGSPATKMIGYWNGSAWVAAGKSRIGTSITMTNKKTTYAISTAGGLSNLSWYEDGDTVNKLATRTGVSGVSGSGNYFHYSPFALSPFNINFTKFWIRAFNPAGTEPVVAIAVEKSNPLQVKLGTVAATSVVLKSNTQVEAIVPAKVSTATNATPVQVVNSDGSTVTLPNGFTYN